MTQDADADFVPDRMMDTVRVAGRVTAGTGQLHTSYLSVFIQDATAGIRLFETSFEQSVQPGDSVVATGVVRQYRGMTQLRVLSYRIVPGPRRLPEPTHVPLAEVAQEDYEGRLVSGWGQVIDVGANSAGNYLLLQDGNEGGHPVLVFVHHTRAEAVALEAYTIGDVLKVVGVVGQFDEVAPYSEQYQVYPRSAADLSPVGVTKRWMTRAGLFAAVLLLVSMLWLGTLRVQVRRRTQELRASEERFRRFTAATVEGLIFQENGRIVDVNAAMCRLVGYSEDELIGMEVALLAAPESRPTVRGAVARHAEECYEVTGLRRDGTTFPAEVQGRSMEVEGRHLRVASVRDVTLRHEHEAAIVAARERAEEMVALKSNLLNNMSHELRTPVSGIMGFADLIREEAPDVYAEFAEHIYESGERLLGTLNAVLEVAQLEADTLLPTLRPTSVASVVHEVVEAAAAAAERKGLTLAMSAGDEVRSVVTDAGMVRRILDHLVDNAIKYTDQGRVDVEVRAGDGCVEVTVRDTGVGISPEFLPHAFELFRQESNGLARTYEGVGLGLSIAHRMVQLLGGTIGVESVPGAGTVCTVQLPMQTDAVLEPAV